jgi:hypothetical protein
VCRAMKASSLVAVPSNSFVETKPLITISTVFLLGQHDPQGFCFRRLVSKAADAGADTIKLLAAPSALWLEGSGRSNLSVAGLDARVS